MATSKEYLGDSVYGSVDGGMIKLTTENGLPNDPSNTIFLEPSVYNNLVSYVEKLKDEKKAGGEIGNAQPLEGPRSKEQEPSGRIGREGVEL